MDLNLVSAFSGIQQAKTAGEIQMRVAGKALDAQRQEGAAAIQLIQSAGQAGAAGDGSGRAAGLGQQVDVYA